MELKPLEHEFNTGTSSSAASGPLLCSNGIDKGSQPSHCLLIPQNPACFVQTSRKLEAMAFLLLRTLPPRHRMDHTSPLPAGVLGAALNHTVFLRREHQRGRGHRSLGSGPCRTSPSAIKPLRVPGDARWKRLAAQRLWE